jgi:hypothetical protein
MLSPVITATELVTGERMTVEVDGVYMQQEAPPDGILRPEFFPGLWFDTAAFWAGDGAKMLAALNVGLDSKVHQKFAAHPAAAK